MDEEKLICLVQKYKEIYDFSDNAYHNQQQKDNIWEEIAGEMKRPVSECKKRWSTLRDAYRKSIKSQETKSGESAKKKKFWRFDKQMSFLRPFLADRQQITNVDQSDSSETETQEREEDGHVEDNVNSPISTPRCPSTSRPSSSASNTSQTRSQMSAQKRSYIKQTKKTLSSAEVLQDYLNERISRNKTSTETQNTSDATTKFFDCMAETVKTLSPQLQIEVKSKIFGIVSDAEIKNMNIRPITSTYSQKDAYANQPSQSKHFHQQNWITTPQPQFHQQQQHQLPYRQPQTQHPSTIPHTPCSQQQAQSLLPHSPYSQQHTTEFTSILSPSTDFTENIVNNNDNDNDITPI